MEKRSVLKVVATKLVGFLIFLILILVANYLRSYIPGEIYEGIVKFLIVNLDLSVLVMVFSLASEISWNYKFPYNLPGPILSAVSSIFIIAYLYKFWIFLDGYISLGVNFPIDVLYYLAYWLIVVIGYIIILVQIKRERKKGKETGNGEIEKEEPVKKRSKREERRARKRK